MGAWPWNPKKKCFCPVTVSVIAGIAAHEMLKTSGQAAGEVLKEKEVNCFKWLWDRVTCQPEINVSEVLDGRGDVEK